MYAIIVGGGKVGFNLAETLLQAGHEVLVVEKDPAKCRRLEDHLGDAVQCTDGTTAKALRDAGLQRASVLIAATGLDENNLVACQVALHLGCQRVVARVNNPRNEEIFRSLGIRATVSSTRIIYTLIEQEVEVGDLVPLLTLRRGNLEIVETTLAPRSPAVGAPVKSLRLPEACILLSVVRGDQVLIPRGDTVLREGDSVLALVRQPESQVLQQVLAAPQGQGDSGG